MHIRRPPSGDGPKIYRPNEPVSMRLEPPSRPVAHSSYSSEPGSIPAPPRDTLLSRVNRRRGQILTVAVSIAAIASFAGVVWWAHNQDVKAGGKGLEPLVVQAPAQPTRLKPENAGGLVPPNQDKEVYNRISPGAVPQQTEKLLPAAGSPQLPANGQLPTPAAPKQEAEAPKTPTPIQQQAASPSTLGPEKPAVADKPVDKPAVADKPEKPAAGEAGPSIASLIDNMSGPTGGWRVQIASVKSEDIAKSTWARLQAAHGDVLAGPLPAYFRHVGSHLLPVRCMDPADGIATS